MYRKWAKESRAGPLPRAEKDIRELSVWEDDTWRYSGSAYLISVLRVVVTLWLPPLSGILSVGLAIRELLR